MEAIITKDTSKTCKSGGLSVLSGGGCKSGGGILNIGGRKNTTKIDENFEGLACKEMTDPVTTTTNIKM